MEKRRLNKDDIEKVRNIEGFPIGSDEDIIALSDAPFYTACPNPFIEDFIEKFGRTYDENTDSYHREPFAADVSEGKNEPIYNAHSYHTKVPYKAIMRYILHYTNPNDIVLDGFCGTGMTGVAANMCEHIDLGFKSRLNFEMQNIKWGRRFPILCDLSPIATLIASNYNSEVDVDRFVQVAEDILQEAYNECSWMYLTQPDVADNCADKATINYTVWSDVLLCQHCGKEIVFYDAAVDPETGKVSDSFFCPHCGAKLKKNDCAIAKVSYHDQRLGKTLDIIKQKPVLINYQLENRKYNKRPDNEDLITINKIDNLTIPYWFPVNRMCEGKESRRNDRIGLTHVHHYFYKRTLYFLSKLFNLIDKSDFKNLLKIMFTSQIINISKMNRYRPQVSFPYNPLSGTLYVSSMICEANPLKAYSGKIKKFAEALSNNRGNKFCISTMSTTNLNIKSNSVDYIFTDPPFGSNLNYSELSFLWESWIKLITNNKFEAIINPPLGKNLTEYQQLMTQCFSEYFRVLKPNRWLTVEFHNSKNAVWNAIQEALLKAGFVVADVRTLDKQTSSFKQVQNNMSVKQDLVISAYKPKESFRALFASNGGTEAGAFAFVRQHLEKLPVVVDADHNGKIDILPERQAFLLFDRMVAYHITNGLSVPVDAADFYKGLDENFIKRDGMYFLPDQINEYDTARIKMGVESFQYDLFISNEKSAIAWLYAQLSEPQTYAEIQPKFMMAVKAVERYEAIPELSVLLEENFLQNQNGCWYVPDVTKEADVAKLREKKLWKEFEGYLNTKGKLKLFRSEAIRVGFSRLWKDKKYQTIVDVANRLPEQTIQEDPNLLMYYDISLSRV